MLLTHRQLDALFILEIPSARVPAPHENRTQNHSLQAPTVMMEDQQVAPALSTGDQITLQDKKGELLGVVTLESFDSYGWWCGSFTPSSGYDAVRPLFVKWTDLVSNQCFGHLDDIEDEISQIGIHAFREGAPLRIFDLQIYDEEDRIGGCFKLADRKDIIAAMT
ncbi:MAG: hypothetical protein ACO1TE_17520 [Prosthecobacter sp.]